MVNCNPETVSTDYDIADRLYFEPITVENVLAIVACEKPVGVIVQFGGQTPLKIARALQRAGVPIVGTSPDAIDLAEDRCRFQALVQRLGLRQPANALATTATEAATLAADVGYPILVRPSYVLGGQAMRIACSPQDLQYCIDEALRASGEQAVLLDHYLDGAIELDVDAISDGQEVVIGGVVEHIERAGVHSGDSACTLPPRSLPPTTVAEVKRQTRVLAKALGVIGLVNVQFAVHEGQVFVLEVNPRASRTVPFVSKATGRPLAKIAARCMLGKTLVQLGELYDSPAPACVSVKEAVFPFRKFPGVDVALGPEMKSTGESMGSGKTFGEAYAKAQLGAGVTLPTSGRVALWIAPERAPLLLPVAQRLLELGFTLVARQALAQRLTEAGITSPIVPLGDIPRGLQGVAMVLAAGDGAGTLRREAVKRAITCYTTVAGLAAGCEAIAVMQTADMPPIRLDEVQSATRPN